MRKAVGLVIIRHSGLTKSWMAKMPSSSMLDRLIWARPSEPTVTDLPVHWPLTLEPEMTSQ